MSSLKFPTLTIASFHPEKVRGGTAFSGRALASVLALAALWSCDKNDAPTSEQTGPQAQEQPASRMPVAGSDRMQGEMMQELRAGCPMTVDGASVAVADTEDGVALTFTTEADHVGDLRARVQQMAEMYGMHAGQRGMMWHPMGSQGRGPGGPGMGMGHMARRGPMPGATAKVTEVDKGARLELQPTDASQLERLREHARFHQQRMATGECWMLQSEPSTAPRGEQE